MYVVLRDESRLIKLYLAQVYCVFGQNLAHHDFSEGQFWLFFCSTPVYLLNQTPQKNIAKIVVSY